MTGSVVFRRNTVEYVEATYAADVDLTGLTVELVLASPGTTPTTGWLPATFGTVAAGSGTWTAVARTNSVVTFSAANFPQYAYEVLVRLTDTPEVPITAAYLAVIDG